MLLAPVLPLAGAVRRRRRTLAGAVLGVATLTSGVAFATTADATETVWDRVANCESGGNWSINTGNGYYGGLQFSAGTWTSFGGQTYAVRADLAAKIEQIDIAKRVLQVQGPNAWPTCGSRAGLTVANGLAVPTFVKLGTGIATGVMRYPRPIPPATGAGGSGTSNTTGVIPLVVDGVRGTNTTKAIEIWVGAPVDGSPSSADNSLLQKKLGVTQDGVVGPVTITALQKVVGVTQDGVWGSGTTMALQTYLNRLLG